MIWRTEHDSKQVRSEGPTSSPQLLAVEFPGFQLKLSLARQAASHLVVRWGRGTSFLVPYHSANVLLFAG